MERSGCQINVTLDPEYAARLTLLAERAHMQVDALARALLSSAIDGADPDARDVIALLDGIPGAYERTMANRAHARVDLDNNTIPLDEL